MRYDLCVNDIKEKGLYELKSMDEFIRVNDLFKGKVVSPGYVAKVFNVTRATVTHWIRRKKIRAFRYRGKEGDYMIIPIVDVINYKNLDSDSFIYDNLIR